MSESRFSVVRLDLPLDAVTFDGMIAAAPGIALEVRKVRDYDAAAWQALATAHVYHVSSARDDMPGRWFVTRVHHRRHADVAAGAGEVLDHEGLVEARLELLASMRISTSEAPPAGNSTTMRTGFSGQAPRPKAAVQARPAAAAAPSRRNSSR